MIVFICISIATFEVKYFDILPNQLSIEYVYLIVIGLYGFIWNGFFNLFYNHILIKK